MAAICRRLDGLPLAVELAAAGPDSATGRPPRPPRAGAPDLDQGAAGSAGPAADDGVDHRLEPRAAGAEEQILFRRLAVFAGGFTLEAAEAVAESLENLQVPVFDGLAVLVDNSLLRQEAGLDGAGRFRMFESVREFGRERLDASDEPRPQPGARCVLPGLCRVGRARAAGRRRPLWIRRVEAEHGNVGAALGWFERADDVVAVQRLAGALGLYWFFEGRWSEGRVWLERALATEGATPDAVRPRHS